MEYPSGIQDSVRNEQLTVTNSSQVVAQPRNEQNKRKMISFRNTADDDTKIITIHLGQGVAVANQGIVLRRYEAYTDSNSEGYECHQGTITAICAVASATADLSVVER